MSVQAQQVQQDPKVPLYTGWRPNTSVGLFGLTTIQSLVMLAAIGVVVVVELTAGVLKAAVQVGASWLPGQAPAGGCSGRVAPAVHAGASPWWSAHGGDGSGSEWCGPGGSGGDQQEGRPVG